MTVMMLIILTIYLEVRELAFKDKIILISGLAGAQKTNLCDIFEKKGFKSISMSKFIYKLMQSSNTIVTLENLMKQSLYIRREFGTTYLAEKCIEEIKNDENSDKYIIDGVRTLEEVDKFRSTYSCVIVLAIHSTPLGRHNYMVTHPKSLVKTTEKSIML